MRILAASDIHGNLETYRWIVGVAEERRAELIVLAGDLLGSGDDGDTIEKAQRRDATRLVSILGALSVPVFYIMGNDDWVELTSPGERVRSLHGGRVDRDEFNFVGYQCTLPFMGGVNERSEEAIASELQPLESLMDERTILVTHSPAAGVLDSTLLGPAGSVSIRDAIRRRGVRAHIHGHVHGSFGRDGRHFNVAAGRQRRAMLIDLNSMIHEVLEGIAQS
jgi:Icc-related predicted phosphoesterase